jgi:hypothetical protein
MQLHCEVLFKHSSCNSDSRGITKIVCYSSEMVLRTIKYTMFYPGSGPSEVIILRQMT